jgi:hypothetical protein
MFLRKLRCVALTFCVLSAVLMPRLAASQTTQRDDREDVLVSMVATLIARSGSLTRATAASSQQTPPSPKYFQTEKL